MAVFRKFWRQSGVFTVYSEHILSSCSIVSVINFEHSQKMKFSIKDFFSKCDQTRMILRIWSHLLSEILDKKLFLFFGWCIKHFFVDLIISELEIM